MKKELLKALTGDSQDFVKKMEVELEENLKKLVENSMETVYSSEFVEEANAPTDQDLANELIVFANNNQRIY